jgi:hypothetical protein
MREVCDMSGTVVLDLKNEMRDRLHGLGLGPDAETYFIPFLMQHAAGQTKTGAEVAALVLEAIEMTTMSLVNEYFKQAFRNEMRSRGQSILDVLIRENADVMRDAQMAFGL